MSYVQLTLSFTQPTLTHSTKVMEVILESNQCMIIMLLTLWLSIFDKIEESKLNNSDPFNMFSHNCCKQICQLKKNLGIISTSNPTEVQF
jgi:hypothetical protein